MKNDIVFKAKEFDMLKKKPIQKLFFGYEYNGTTSKEEKSYQNHADKFFSGFTNDNKTTCTSTKN